MPISCIVVYLYVYIIVYAKYVDIIIIIVWLLPYSFIFELYYII